MNTSTATFKATDLATKEVKIFTVTDVIYESFDARPRGMGGSSSADGLADIESEYKGC